MWLFAVAGVSTASTSTPLPSSMCNAATNGFTVTESYVLGQAGEQLTTYTWSGSQSTSVATWARTNVYGDGELLATYDTVGAGLHFHLTDHLGTRRVQTDAAGTPETDCQSLLYGDGLNCFAAPGAAATGASGDDATPLHFTGKQRDTESGNDYFGARYFASSTGRFMSPDWAKDAEAVPYANFGNPQSLNLYAYVGNNPFAGIDATGHYSEADSTDENGDHAYQNKVDETVAKLNSTEEWTFSGAVYLAQQQNNGKGQQNQTDSSGHPINKDAIANYADQHAEKGSLGKCAAYCRRAFEAGGVDTSGHPLDAKDWGPTLLKNGAVVVSPDGYTPQKADTAVFAGSDAHPHGHIAVYDGKQWVSDFKQRNMSPYRTAAPPVTTYRFPDN